MLSKCHTVSVRDSHFFNNRYVIKVLLQILQIGCWHSQHGPLRIRAVWITVITMVSIEKNSLPSLRGPQMRTSFCREIKSRYRSLCAWVNTWVAAWQVKLCDPLTDNACHTQALLWWNCLTMRRYIKCPLGAYIYLQLTVCTYPECMHR